MGAIELVGLITAGIPFVSKFVKGIFKTKKMKQPYQKGVNTLIPIIIGILSSGTVAYSQGMDWMTALAVGLGSGGVASSVRDAEKNLVGLVGALSKIFANKK